jgi:DNA-binding transcriptional LysR family regulator
MELNQLYCFLQVAKTQHMTRAADLLHITQPALSKIISRLEEDLGVKLFDRQGKNIRLNEYGRVALRYTEQVLYALDDMQTELDQMAAGQAGHIRIGSGFSSQEPHFLHTAVRQFALERSDVQFSLIQYSTRNLLFALENREIDIAVTSKPILKEGILWQELFTERMGILLSEDHPLAAKKTLSLLDLQNERFYCNNSNSDVYDLTYAFCTQAGFQPNIHFEGDFPSLIGEAISRGYGVSILSDRSFQHFAQKSNPKPWEKKLTFRLLEEPYCRRICGIARMETRSLTSLSGTFYRYLQKQCEAEQSETGDQLRTNPSHTNTPILVE